MHQHEQFVGTDSIVVVTVGVNTNNDNDGPEVREVEIVEGGWYRLADGTFEFEPRRAGDGADIDDEWPAQLRGKVRVTELNLHTSSCQRRRRWRRV